MRTMVKACDYCRQAHLHMPGSRTIHGFSETGAGGGGREGGGRLLQRQSKAILGNHNVTPGLQCITITGKGEESSSSTQK